MTRVFLITDTRVDDQAGHTTHLRELFENLQRFSDTYLVAPYAQKKPNHERILSIPSEIVPIPVLQTMLFRTAFLFHLLYQTVRRSPDAFYLRHSPLGAFPPLVAKVVGVPLVVEVNGILVDEHESTDERPWLSRVILAIERVTFRFADRFVAVTPAIAEYIHRRYDVPKNRITYVPNGANVDLFSPQGKDECKDELGLESDASFVCFVGNLAPWQGVEYLLRSAPSVLSAVPDAKLLVVGDGVRRDELEELSAELDLEDDVLFTGEVPYETVPRYVNASDVCVVYKTPMKSGYSPLKLFEYMACGRPVVASDTKGFEILEERSAGLLVRPEDSSALARTITELLCDDAMRERMGENGRSYVVAHRSWKHTTEKVFDVIDAAVGDQSDDG